MQHPHQNLARPTPRVASQREVRETLLAPLDGEHHGEKSSFIGVCKAFFTPVDMPADKDGDSSETEELELPFDFPSPKVRIAPPSRARALPSQRARACGPNPIPSARPRAQHVQTGAQLDEMCIFMLNTFELEHKQPTVELCAIAIAFFLAFSWHAEPRIKGKGEVASEGYVRFQDNHLIIGMLPRVLNCECHTYRTCALPSLYSRTAPAHLTCI